MPTVVQFFTKDGKLKTFRAKSNKRASAKTSKELERRLKKLKSPKMRSAARAKWRAAHA